MNLFHFGANTLGFDIWLYLQGLFSIFPKLLYLLSNAFLTVIDLLQMIFRKLAGLDVYYVDGTAQEGDIVYHFLRGTVMGEFPILTNVFWSLIILGVILLIISTIISVIRSEYASDKVEPKSKILGQSIKSVIFMAIVPIVVLFGVYLSNVVLQAVDKATSLSSGASFKFLDTSKLQESRTGADENTVTYVHYNFFSFAIPTTTTPFSSVIFNVSCYEANRVRQTEGVALKSSDTEYINGFLGLLNEGEANNWNNLFSGDNVDQVAAAIDEAFANYVQLREGDYAKLNYPKGYIEDANPSGVDVFVIQTMLECEGFDRYNLSMVWYYYNLWFYNFLVAFGAGIMITVVFINLTIGLMGRLIELLALFLVAAPLISIMPLDNGNAYNAWRGKFVGKTLMVISAVGGMNIVFLILPYLNEISFFNFGPFDYIVSILYIFVALQLVQSFIGMISSFIKSEDLNESGGKLAKELGSNVAKAGMLAAGAGGLALKGAAVMSSAGALGKYGKMGVDVLKANTVKGRQARADAFNLERENYRHETLQDDKVAAEAVKDVRYSGAYAGMTDQQFETEIRRDDASRASYEHAIQQRKIDIASQRVQTKFGDEQTINDIQPARWQMAKESIRKDSDQGFKEAAGSLGGVFKSMLEPYQSSSLYSGWKESASVEKLVVKIDMPIFSKMVKDKLKNEDLQKAIKEAQLKQDAMKEVKN